MNTKSNQSLVASATQYHPIPFPDDNAAHKPATQHYPKPFYFGNNNAAHNTSTHHRPKPFYFGENSSAHNTSTQNSQENDEFDDATTQPYSSQRFHKEDNQATDSEGDENEDKQDEERYAGEEDNETTKNSIKRPPLREIPITPQPFLSDTNPIKRPPLQDIPSTSQQYLPSSQKYTTIPDNGAYVVQSLQQSNDQFEDLMVQQYQYNMNRLQRLLALPPSTDAQEHNQREQQISSLSNENYVLQENIMRLRMLKYLQNCQLFNISSLTYNNR